MQRNTAALKFITTLRLTLPLRVLHYTSAFRSNKYVCSNLPRQEKYSVSLFFFFFFYLVSALLRDYSLCWDCWRGTWLLHLMQPCLYVVHRGYSVLFRINYLLCRRLNSELWILIHSPMCCHVTHWSIQNLKWWNILESSEIYLWIFSE